MKSFIMDFLRRGTAAAGIGPIVLAVLYLILRQTEGLRSLSVEQVCVGIFSVTALAFAAGGLNALYRVERLPLMAAVLLHGAVLYIGYLGTYLLNDWLQWGRTPVLVFTAIFVVGYLLIWAVIYFAVRKNTARLNSLLEEKQRFSKAQ